MFPQFYYTYINVKYTWESHDLVCVFESIINIHAGVVMVWVWLDHFSAILLLKSVLTILCYIALLCVKLTDILRNINNVI